jgi:hypothetical protein
MNVLNFQVMDALSSSKRPEVIKKVEKRIWDVLFLIANGDISEEDAVKQLFQPGSSLLDLIENMLPSENLFFFSGMPKDSTLTSFPTVCYRLGGSTRSD